MWPLLFVVTFIQHFFRREIFFTILCLLKSAQPPLRQHFDRHYMAGPLFNSRPRPCYYVAYVIIYSTPLFRLNNNNRPIYVAMVDVDGCTCSCSQQFTHPKLDGLV